MYENGEVEIVQDDLPLNSVLRVEVVTVPKPVTKVTIELKKPERVWAPESVDGVPAGFVWRGGVAVTIGLDADEEDVTLSVPGLDAARVADFLSLVLAATDYQRQIEEAENFAYALAREAVDHDWWWRRGLAWSEYPREGFMDEVDRAHAHLDYLELEFQKLDQQFKDEGFADLEIVGVKRYYSGEGAYIEQELRGTGLRHAVKALEAGMTPLNSGAVHAIHNTHAEFVPVAAIAGFLRNGVWAALGEAGSVATFGPEGYAIGGVAMGAIQGAGALVKGLRSVFSKEIAPAVAAEARYASYIELKSALSQTLSRPISVSEALMAHRLGFRATHLSGTASKAVSGASRARVLPVQYANLLDGVAGEYVARFRLVPFKNPILRPFLKKVQFLDDVLYLNRNLPMKEVLNTIKHERFHSWFAQTFPGIAHYVGRSRIPGFRGPLSYLEELMAYGVEKALPSVPTLRPILPFGVHPLKAFRSLTPV